MELAFEYGSEGSLGTDLERLQLGYVASDNLTLWAGRFHTPYGYWNTAFHHGAQIQTSITRPRMIAFEDQGGILPAHSVGLWATGKFRSAWGDWHYDAYLNNADSLRDGTLDYNASGHDHAAPGSGFNLGLQPTGLPGLTVGAHGLQQQVNSYSSDTLNGSVKLQVLGGYVFYESDRAEVIGEYYGFNNTDRWGSAGRNRSRAGFMQAGYQVLDRWTGFARYERAALNSADPYFNLMNIVGGTQFGSSYTQHTVGVRYDLDPRSALKAQLERIRQTDGTDTSTTALRLQYAVRF